MGMRNRTKLCSARECIVLDNTYQTVWISQVTRGVASSLSIGHTVRSRPVYLFTFNS